MKQVAISACTQTGKDISSSTAFFLRKALPIFYSGEPCGRERSGAAAALPTFSLPKSLADCVLRLLLRQSQAHEFQQLFSRNLPDGRLMNKARFGTCRIYFRRRQDACTVEHDPVALHMPEAFILSDEVGTEMLPRTPLCHRTAYDIRTAPFARQFYLEIGKSALFSVRQYFFFDEEACVLAHRGIRLSVGGGHAAELGGFEYELRILLQINFCDRVKYLFSAAVTGSIMPLDIAYFGVF